MRLTVIVFLFLNLLCLKNSFAQKEATLYQNVLEDGNLKQKYWQVKNNKNEIETFFSGLFLLYKNFFSSQDLSVCTFTPSCSEYGMLAVKAHGLVKGGVMTMDRLTRCNGLSPQNYEIDQKTLLLKDDPRDKHLVPIIVSY